MLPRMTIGGDSVFVHYPTVGAEGDLFPLVVPIIEVTRDKQSVLWSWRITYSRSDWIAMPGGTTAIRGLSA